MIPIEHQYFRNIMFHRCNYKQFLCIVRLNRTKKRTSRKQWYPNQRTNGFSHLDLNTSMYQRFAKVLQNVENL